MKPAKNLEIEYLRGISILLVLISHSILLSPYLGKVISPLFQHLSFGVGVDLFFCISGYVVSSSFLNKLDENPNFWRTASTFWIRRTFRLLPSAWLWVILGIICSVLFNKSGLFLTLEQNLKSFATIATFSANIGAFFNWLAPNYPYWSLALEEQFYILFPFFMLLFKTLNMRIFFLILIIATQFPLRRDPFGPEAAQYLAAFRTDGFAWGVLIYLISQTRLHEKVRPFLLERSLWLKILATLSTLYLLVWSPAYFYHTPYAVGILAFVTAMLVWLASYSRQYIYVPRMAKPLFLWLGSRSYAIYLIHLFAFRLLQEFTFRYIESDIPQWGLEISLSLGIGVLIAIALFAEINFRLIETPARNYGVRLTSER